MKNYYSKEDYVSVWVGRCKSMDKFNDYIRLKYDKEEEEFCFELGNDFGIISYDEDFSLVYYSDDATKDLSVLLDTGAPDYVTEHFVEQKGQYLQEEFNCCVMFYDMDYTGEVKAVLNEKYGKFVYLGSLASDKYDML